MVLTINGVGYALTPDYAMQTQAPAAHAQAPAAHSQDAWWQGADGHLYLKNRNGAVQAYTVK